MKKTLLFILATVCLTVAVSCQKEDSVRQKDEHPVFTATIENSQTKTTIDANPSSKTAGKVSWEMTDVITVTDHAGNTAVYGISSINEGKAVFEYQSGNVLKESPYTALYGNDPLTAQSYNPSAANLPMTATSETTEFTFRVTCGLLKLTLTKAEENISSIIVTGTPTGGQETEYCLSCEDAIEIDSATDFYIALPAGNYTKYVFYDSDGKFCTKTAKKGNSTVIEANKIQPVTFSTSLNFDYEYVDLSSTETANCYIVSSAGHYKFKAVKGNTSASAGDVKGVKVLWESFGTAVTPSVGDLVKADVSYADNYIRFNTNDKYQEGNAVIAAYSDAGCTDGNVLWSWHIWLTDTPQEQVYNNNSGTMLDRNLGATSATPGDLGALGLLYQWGRKDPFIGNVSVTNEGNYGTDAASTIQWNNTGSNVHGTIHGTIEYAIANPTHFIKCNDTNNDWYYTGTADTDNTRWQSTKTMYDPCPAGWRVPDGGSSSIWATAFGLSTEFSKGPWDSTNRGMNFGTDNGKETSMQLGKTGTIWYPAAGCRSYDTSGLKYPGSNGYYWTCSPDECSAICFFFDPTAKVIISSGRERAAARSVRCIAE